MSKRVCAEPGCPTLTTPGNTYCHTHARTRDRARGTRQERGYNNEYDRERRKVKAQVTQGGAHCWRCGKPINPEDTFDLGHDDFDRTILRGAEHVKCNRATRNRRAKNTPGG